jgi:hypothetical protein
MELPRISMEAGAEAMVEAPVETTVMEEDQTEVCRVTETELEAGVEVGMAANQTEPGEQAGVEIGGIEDQTEPEVQAEVEVGMMRDQPWWMINGKVRSTEHGSSFVSNSTRDIHMQSILGTVSR